MGEAGCGTKCSRFTLVTLNIIFLICGIAFVVLGALFRFGSDKLKSEVEDSLSHVQVGDYTLYELATNLAIIFMVAGAVMVLFSFLGFVGACCMSKCALWLYGILVVAVLVVELAGVILFFIMKAEFEDGVRKGLAKSIDLANNPTNKALNAAEKEVQDAQQNSLEYLFVQFECCHSSNNSRLVDNGEAKSICDAGGSAYEKDCYDAIKEWIESYQTAFIAIGIAVIVVEVLLILCTIAMCRYAGKKSRYT